MSEIKNKVVVITGASSGIGAATARLLARKEAKVVLASRNLEALTLLCKEIEAFGGCAAAVKADVRKRKDLENVAEFSLAKFGKIDVLVNNAGIAPISRFDELRVSDWEDMIDVNLRGVLYGIAAFLPVFQRQNFGHFVNIISTAGIKIVPTMGVYAATKNAVRTISEALRQEAGPNIRVTGISPGYVKTNLSSSMTNLEILKAGQAKMDEIGIPPEAIARAIEYAIEQPPEIDVGDIVIRPTAQE